MCAVQILSASAEGGDTSSQYLLSAVVNPDTGMVSLSGKIPEINKETEISLVVLNPGYSAADAASVTDAALNVGADGKTPVINCFAQITSQADGSWNYDFALDGEAGRYHLLLNYEKHDGYLVPEKYISFVLPADVEEALALINACKTSDEFRQTLEGKLEVFGFDSEAYDALIDGGKVLLNEHLMAARPLADITSAREQFAVALAFAQIKTAKTAGEAAKAVENNASVLKINEESLWKNSYKNLSNDGKNGMYNSLLGFAAAKSLSDVRNILLDGILCSAVSDAQVWTVINPLILANADRLPGLDISKYKALSSTADVDKAIAGKSYATPADLARAINSAMAASGGSGGGTSGGSGGSSGGGSRVPSLPGTSTKPNDTVTGFPFRDMEQTTWAKDAVEKLYKKGIVNGKSADCFAPNDFVTREEFAKLIVTVFGIEKSNGNGGFDDVSADEWYAPYVSAAYEKGLITGKGDGSFGVGEAISRQDVCVIVYRALLLMRGFDENGELSFADSDSIADYARDAVAALYGAEIIHGTDNNCFAPLDGTTRAQAAVICSSLVE